jgi:beta-galactosidase
MKPFLKSLILIPCLVMTTAAVKLTAAESPRQHLELDDNWRFYLGDPKDGATTGLDDSIWRTVTLPHDWSIEGKMDPKAPMGGQGGFLPAGIAWYRHHLDVPTGWKDKRVRVEFEGVYMNAEIYLNGQKLDFHPYGFTSFFVDLTPALKIGADNLLAVRVDNSQQKNARWYTGSGIYRHVWLDVTDPVQVAPWGVCVCVPEANAKSAKITVKTTLLNQRSMPGSAKVVTVILGPDGLEIGRNEASVGLPASGSQEITQDVALTDPPLWFPETPQLSSVVTDVVVEGQTVDEVTTKFGVRALAWSADKGLTINGKTYKLSGGCIHDDNGVLGACAFDRAEERKVELLKAAGFTALRTAHNPPSPALLDACDRLGMLVLDEAFDCWVDGKNTYDYHVIFKDWWQRDIDSMVMRDRNHPAVVMWSIGNEIPYVFFAMGDEYSPKLVNEIHSLDSTRPVTNGINGWPAGIKVPQSPSPNQPAFTSTDLAHADAAGPKDPACWTSLDIVGSNYRLAGHIARHALFPDRVLVSTESNPPLGEPDHVMDNTFVVGDFVWSAQDYLGEVGLGRWFYEGDPTEPMVTHKNQPPTKLYPIAHGSDELYPWRGAVCGNLDLLGNSKPAAHLRNIVWNMGEKLYLAVRQPEDDKKIIIYGGYSWFPVWENWTWPGREGKAMGVDVYSRYPSVRLYLNGKLVDERPTTRKQNFQATFTVPYQPGTLKTVGVENGQETETMQLETASEPAIIRLIPDRASINADGQDLSFIQVDVLDKQGRPQPNADELISFKLTGPGTIAGLGNAWLDGTEPYQGSECHVYHGRALIVIRTFKKAGTLQLEAHSPGLASSNVEITSK